MTSRHELGLNKFSQMTSQRVKNKKVRIPKTSFLMSRTGFVWLTNGTTLRNLGQSKTEFKYWTDESDVWSKMKSSGVTVVLYTLWRLWWSIRIHTHTRKNVIYLFYTTKIQMVYWRHLYDGLFGGMEKEKQVCWRHLTWIWRHLCVFFNRSRSTTNRNAHRSHVIVLIQIVTHVEKYLYREKDCVPEWTLWHAIFWTWKEMLISWSIHDFVCCHTSVEHLQK